VVDGSFVSADCLQDIKQLFNKKISLYTTSYQPSKDVFFSKKSLNYVILTFVIHEEITLEKQWNTVLIAYDSGIV
jgi:hypothetical protein